MDPNQQPKSQIHVRSDSKDSLDALFLHAHDRMSSLNGPKSGKPFRERNLPDSFFTPPPASQPPNPHRRTVSEPTLNYSQQPMNNPQSINRQQNQSPGNEFINHQINHQRNASTPNVLDSQLPQNWEARATATGQKYYINHVDRTTTWEDPRKTLSLTMLPLNSQQAQQQQAQQQQHSMGPLPEGWEQAVTADGEVYYINHVRKTTSWVDPRLTTTQQQSMGPTSPPNMGSTSPSPMNVQNMHLLKQQQQQHQQRQFMMQQQQQQAQHQRNGSNHLVDPILSSNSLLGNLVRDKYGPLQMSGGGMGIHGRVESADSGLDGMGTLLTPPVDDSMNAMEDVDMEGTQPLSNQSQNPDLRLNHNNRLPDFFDSMQGTSVDIGTLDNEPSLDTMNSGMLNDMDIQNMDIPSTLTWL